MASTSAPACTLASSSSPLALTSTSTGTKRAARVAVPQDDRCRDRAVRGDRHPLGSTVRGPRAIRAHRISAGKTIPATGRSTRPNCTGCSRQPSRPRNGMTQHCRRRSTPCERYPKNCCWRRRSGRRDGAGSWLDGRFRPSLAYPVPCRDTLGLWAVAPAANGSPG
jgi:hypothetical protein